MQIAHSYCQPQNLVYEKSYQDIVECGSKMLINRKLKSGKKNS